MPQRFTFRLQPILKLREALEKEAQRNLARMMEFQREEEAHLDALAKEREDVLAVRRSPPGAILDMPTWKAAERYLVVIERRIVAAEVALAEAIKRVLDARQALLQAHREHLMLVRLKERKWEQFQVDTSRAEAKETDDLTVLRFRRAPKVPLTAS
jgi:flagellar FliJ protein